MASERQKGPNVGEIQVEADSVCVLFDSSTGDVRHIHRVVTLPGGERLSKETIEQRARSLAKQAGTEVDRLEAIHVKPKAVEVQGCFRVNLRSRKLEVEERRTNRLS